MALRDYQCANYGCGEDAATVWISHVGAIYGACERHQPSNPHAWLYGPCPFGERGCIDKAHHALAMRDDARARSMYWDKVTYRI